MDPNVVLLPCEVVLSNYPSGMHKILGLSSSSRLICTCSAEFSLVGHTRWCSFHKKPYIFWGRGDKCRPTRLHIGSRLQLLSPGSLFVSSVYIYPHPRAELLPRKNSPVLIPPSPGNPEHHLTGRATVCFQTVGFHGQQVPRALPSSSPCFYQWMSSNGGTFTAPDPNLDTRNDASYHFLTGPVFAVGLRQEALGKQTTLFGRDKAPCNTHDSRIHQYNF